MDKTRTIITIAGQDLKITGDESEKYIRQLSDFVNGKIYEVQRLYPTLSTGTCVLLASLNMADELHKLRSDYEALDQRINQLMDMPKAGTGPSAPVKRPFARETVVTK